MGRGGGGGPGGHWGGARGRRRGAEGGGWGTTLPLRWSPGPPAGVGTAAEGIGALRALVAGHPALSDLAANVDERIVCTAGVMVQRQGTAAGSRAWPGPELGGGAWCSRGDNPV